MKRYSELVHIGFDKNRDHSNDQSFEEIARELDTSLKWASENLSKSGLDIEEIDKDYLDEIIIRHCHNDVMGDNILLRNDVDFADFMSNYSDDIQIKSDKYYCIENCLWFIQTLRNPFYNIGGTQEERFAQTLQFDMWNELYLWMKIEKGEKEKISLSKDVVEVNGNDEIENANQFIRNKRKAQTSLPFEFTIPKSVNKNTEIDSVGAGIVQACLCYKDFRDCLKFSEKNISCYWENMVKNLEKFSPSQDRNAESNSKILFDTTDWIILEKTQGFNTIITFENYILPYTKGFSDGDFEEVKKFAKKIVEYPGCFTRCTWIRLLGYELQKLSDYDHVYRRRVIESFTYFLTENMETMKSDYDRLLSAFAWKNHQQNDETIKSILEDTPNYITDEYYLNIDKFKENRGKNSVKNNSQAQKVIHTIRTSIANYYK